MKKFCWLFFILLLPGLLAAQYERILNDRNVIWAAEIDLTYDLQGPRPADSLHRNDIILWKSFDAKNLSPYEHGELLIEKILQAARTGKWAAWQFADTVRQLSKEELIARLDERDTIDVLDVETGMRKWKAAVNEADPASFQAIRLKQLLYFDEKKGDFELYTAAIGPVKRVTTRVLQKSGEYLEIPRYEYVPFWLKMPDFSRKKSPKKRNVNDENISWAAQIKTLDASPELETLRPFKDFKRPIMQVLLDRFHFDRKYAAQNALEQAILFEERNAMLSSADTIVTFDPETYEEKIFTVQNRVDADQVLRLRMVQNWFWDDRQSRLIIQFAGFAPLMQQYDSEGNFRFDRPLFYRWKK